MNARNSPDVDTGTQAVSKYYALVYQAGIANVNLIAAAPELLATLERLETVATKMLSGGFNGRMADMHRAIGEATELSRAAISKAKGGL